MHRNKFKYDMQDLHGENEPLLKDMKEGLNKRRDTLIYHIRG